MNWLVENHIYKVVDLHNSVKCIIAAPCDQKEMTTTTKKNQVLFGQIEISTEEWCVVLVFVVA